MYRNHNCGELTIKNVGEKVTLAGWVQKIRNLGSMKFIDLRDEFGITQIVISSESSITDEDLKNVSTECVIQVVGNVVERSNKNDKIPTGEIEIDAEKVLLTLQNKREKFFWKISTHLLTVLTINAITYIKLRNSKVTDGQECL